MSTHDQTDEGVMSRLAGGDDAALAELMTRWEGPIWCFIQRMCGPGGAVDEIYQEVWTRLYLYRQRYRPPKPFRPYLFSIAVNCCRTAIKRAGRYDWQSARLDDAPPPTADDPPPLEGLVAAEESARLHSAVASLPPQQRAVVLLYMLCDSSYARIAVVLGKRVGTVRSHMHHALAALRGTLTRIALERPAGQAGPKGKVHHERIN